MALADGRKLAYCEWGDLTGMPVVLLHGWQNSRLFCPDAAATVMAGVRLITFDRPGYGASDPRPGRTLLSAAEDYAELADALDLSACPVIGWSGGGPYALSFAVQLPHLVSAAGLAASDGPWAEVPGALQSLPADARELHARLVTDPVHAADDVRARCRRNGESWERMFEAVGSRPDDPDDVVMSKPEVRASMMAWFAEGARRGTEGFAEDWIAELSPWGFSPADVNRPVVVWHGGADRLVDRVHADYLATAIPNAVLVNYPDDGHMFPVVHWGEMLRLILTLQRMQRESRSRSDLPGGREARRGAPNPRVPYGFHSRPSGFSLASQSRSAEPRRA